MYERTHRIRGSLAVAALLALVGCDSFPKTEYGKTLTEPATVESLAYVPAGHGGGSGVGMSMSGNLVVTANSVDIPARYAVVFVCEHGKFVIEGHKQMWGRLRQGQRVTVTYREVYEVLYKDKVEQSRKIVDLDFIDAQ